MKTAREPGQLSVGTEKGSKVPSQHLQNETKVSAWLGTHLPIHGEAAELRGRRGESLAGQNRSSRVCKGETTGSGKPSPAGSQGSQAGGSVRKD